jgi:hypothetical protein
MDTLIREIATWNDIESCDPTESGIRDYVFESMVGLTSGYVVLVNGARNKIERSEVTKWLTDRETPRKVCFHSWCGAIYVTVFYEYSDALAFYLTYV